MLKIKKYFSIEILYLIDIISQALSPNPKSEVPERKDLYFQLW